MKESDNRYHILDVLKGLCIIFICITHFDWTNKERLALGFPFEIDMAVPIFMLISGYVSAVSYEHHKINRICEAYKIGFFCKKILRFTIPFFIVFCFETGISVVAFHTKITPLNCICSFLAGGKGPGGVLFSNYDTTNPALPNHLFCYEKKPVTGIGCVFLYKCVLGIFTVRHCAGYITLPSFDLQIHFFNSRRLPSAFL